MYLNNLLSGNPEKIVPAEQSFVGFVSTATLGAGSLLVRSETTQRVLKRGLLFDESRGLLPSDPVRLQGRVMVSEYGHGPQRKRGSLCELD
jgi:hypothetical protein